MIRKNLPLQKTNHFISSKNGVLLAIAMGDCHQFVIFQIFCYICNSLTLTAHFVIMKMGKMGILYKNLK